MDENKSITYDDLIQTRNTQILKSIVPYLDVPAQKPLAMLIQDRKSDGMEKCHSSFLQTGEQHGCLFSACRYQTAGCNA